MGPPGGPNSFNFMQFLGKFGKFLCLRPPPGSWCPLFGEILDPPLGLNNFETKTRMAGPEFLRLCGQFSLQRKPGEMKKGLRGHYLIVLVDRKTDGFQDEICPEWKRDKQKLETLF